MFVPVFVVNPYYQYLICLNFFENFCATRVKFGLIQGGKFVCEGFFERKFGGKGWEYYDVLMNCFFEKHFANSKKCCAFAAKL
jgi:hypothetical protein